MEDGALDLLYFNARDQLHDLIYPSEQHPTAAEPPGPPGGNTLPARLRIAGERRYTTLIVQNLLENARKYNRLGGRIDIRGDEDDCGGVRLTFGSTGAGIGPDARESVFERFHRGHAGEDAPGHGLGLNLANSPGCTVATCGWCARMETGQSSKPPSVCIIPLQQA